MPVSYTILKDLDVVYVRYWGRASMAEGMTCFGDYLTHPDAHAGQKQLIDLSAVTEPISDYADAMKFMAKMADMFHKASPQTLLVCYAPHEIARQSAYVGLRSWAGVDHMVFRVMDDEVAALRFLGLPVDSIAELLASA